VVQDYRSTGLSLRRHPVAFLRGEMAARGMLTNEGLARLRNGRRATIGGLVLVRQKPGSAKGVMFITLEDETGVANIIVWPALFEQQRRLILSARMMAVRGQVQHEGGHEGGTVHLIAEALSDLTPLLDTVGIRGENFPLPLTRGDEARGGGAPGQRGSIRVATRDFR
jgi:error-prone DNA polymerase